jgi:hypothetical protein
MKTVVAVLLAAAIGFGAAWFVISRKQHGKAAALAASEANWQQEKAYLEQALADARRRGPEVRTVTRTYSTTVTNKLSAQELLDRLVNLHPETSEDSRSRVFRQIVHYLQMLAEEGPEVLPVIANFLKQNKDVDYSSDVLNAAGERVGRSGTSSFNARNITQTDFLVPPSLRLGLVDVLDQIGGDEAQAILAEVLDTTGRGVEVAYIARVLQEESPDKYKDNALKAAKDLLANPPSVDQPNRIDENARAYLFQVLAMYNDTSFAQTAQGMLITPDGRIDRQALSYLNATLKDQAVPMLHAAYTNPRLTNQTEKSNLLNAMLNFAGPSAQANQMLNQLVTDESIPSPIRAFTIQNLAGAPGRERPTDPQIIKSRIQVLQNLRGSLKDERILRSIDETVATLQKFLAAASQPGQ